MLGSEGKREGLPQGKGEEGKRGEKERDGGTDGETIERLKGNFWRGSQILAQNCSLDGLK